MRLPLAVSVLCVACSPTARDDNGNGGVDAAPGDDATGVPGDGAPPETTFVYAHTARELYQVDPDTLEVTRVGTFTGNDDITDIAIDKTGTMIGISFGSVYRIDPSTAATTRLSNGLTGEFNGLSFVPAEAVGQTGDDVLVATRNADGMVFRIDPATGATTPIGDMGGFSSSGDLVSVADLGTLQTADNGLFDADRLVRLAPGTFTATQVGQTIGFAEIWGLAFWKDKLFGFTSNGEFITIDPNTGGGTLIESSGLEWWGAAVTTSAPVIL